MRIAGHVLRLACVVGIGLAASLAEAPVRAADSHIANQSWYPEGYLDLRIATAAQVESFPREPLAVLFEDWDNPRLKTYDLIDCNLGYDLPEMEPYQSELALLALDVARMRSEFEDLGYRREIYDEPLLAYERAALAEIEAHRDEPPESIEGEDELPPEDDEPIDYLALQDATPLGQLAREMEARRTRLQPGKPQIIIEGGCGAGESEFTISLVPANGELWLINAFAFRVCERKVADPWDHGACGWTQYAEGDNTFASGRYMYEARWPNGTVKRGARVLQGDFEEDGGAVITFRRN